MKKRKSPTKLRQLGIMDLTSRGKGHVQRRSAGAMGDQRKVRSWKDEVDEELYTQEELDVYEDDDALWHDDYDWRDEDWDDTSWGEY